MQNLLMGIKKPRTNDRHKPSRMLRVRGPLAEVIQAIANENASDFTEEGNRILREWLEKAGLWKNKPAPESNA